MSALGTPHEKISTYSGAGEESPLRRRCSILAKHFHTVIAGIKEAGPESLFTPDRLFYCVLTAAHSSMASVPETRNTRPRAERRVNVSWNTIQEKITVTRMLSLSMGTTTLAGPSWSAR